MFAYIIVFSRLIRLICTLNVNKHDKSSRSPGPSCIFWQRHRRAHTFLGTVPRLFIPASIHCTLVVHLTSCLYFTADLSQNRFASVEVSLTIMKTETTQTEYRQKDRIQKDRYTGVVIESVPD